MEDNSKQTEEEKQIQKEEIKPIEKMIKTKVLGLMLLIFTLFWTFLGMYNFITFVDIELTIYHIILYVFSYFVGIALLLIKKRGIIHIILVLCGSILLALCIGLVLLLLL